MNKVQSLLSPLAAANAAITADSPSGFADGIEARAAGQGRPVRGFTVEIEGDGK